MKKIAVFLLIVGFVACHSNSSDTSSKQIVNAAKKIVSSAAFDSSFGKLLTDYFNLKDNFIVESDTMISFYSRALIKDADSLNVDDIKADSVVTETAKMNAESISAELQGLLEEKTLENKRKSFYTMSEQLYELMKAVQYNKTVVYQLHCPMAFDGDGANWLSNSTEIKNPYIPKKMMNCGSVKDTLDFTK